MSDHDPLQDSIDAKMGHMANEKEKQRERKKSGKGIAAVIVAIVIGVVMLIRIFA